MLERHVNVTENIRVARCLPFRQPVGLDDMDRHTTASEAPENHIPTRGHFSIWREGDISELL